ncbi:MAG: hypothetical protein HZY73_13215 [Micropruina sp.]|nr:MAG: hypothetical protein HZY73_13215 [Micropruina sp.]
MRRPRACRPGVAIPDQALRLRLCAAGEQQLRQWAPLDALESERAAAVLAVLAALPRADANQACTAELGPEFLLIGEFAGREPVAMPLRLYGCRTVGTPDDQRNGADKVLDAFRTELAAQRAATSPPAAGQRTTPRCTPHWTPRAP